MEFGILYTGKSSYMQQELRKNTIVNPIEIFFQTHMFLGLQQVKNNCGLQDDNQARMNTQQATGLLREMQTMTLKD